MIRLSQRDINSGLSSILYHSTDFNKTLNILNDNQFKLTSSLGAKNDMGNNKNKLFYFSTSRSPFGDYNRSLANAPTILVLDGEKLSQNYSGGPFDYWGPEARSRNPQSSEMEDRIWSDKMYIPNASKYIKEIHALVGRSYEYENDDDEISKIRKLTLAGIQKGIPIYAYRKEEDYKFLNKKQAIPKNELLSKYIRKNNKNSFPQKKERLSEKTKHLQAIIELSLKNNLESLSWFAAKISGYSLGGYQLKEIIKQAEAEIFNIRKSGSPIVQKISDLIKSSGAGNLKEYITNLLETKWKPLELAKVKKEREAWNNGGEENFLNRQKAWEERQEKELAVASINKRIKLSERDWILYLDDCRNPKDGRPWTIARTITEAKELIMNQGVPSFISFDHDIDDDGTGMDFARWLTEMDLDGTIDIGPNFNYYVHSANPEGSKNIDGLMKNYLQFKRGK